MSCLRRCREGRRGEEHLPLVDDQAARELESLASEVDAENLTEEEKSAKIQALPLRARAKYLLGSGVLRLLSAAWLLAQEEFYVIERMQDLPAEAFIDPKRAEEMFEFEMRVILLSLGWLSRRHPDPRGVYMQIIQTYLRRHRMHFNNRKKLYKGGPDFGVFWDFACLPQDPPDGGEKTEAEKLTRARALSAIHGLYGDKFTLVAHVTSLPQGPLAEGHAADWTPYEERGWCYFESIVSCIHKPRTRFLDISAVADAEPDSPETDDETAPRWKRLMSYLQGQYRLFCVYPSWVLDASNTFTAVRPPPVTPEDMATELLKRDFVQRSDANLLIELYKEFFDEVKSTTRVMNLRNMSTKPGWGDAELELLAKVLPAFSNCKILMIQGNTEVTEQGIELLRERLPELKALCDCHLPRHLEETPRGQAFAKAWETAGKRAEMLRWF